MQHELRRNGWWGWARRDFNFVEEEGLTWTVMPDPEGNEFCVLQSPN